MKHRLGDGFRGIGNGTQVDDSGHGNHSDIIKFYTPEGEDTRERQMLDNLMDLVIATKLASSRKMSRSRIRAYIKHMLAWLTGLRELFPGIYLESNQHL